MSQNIPWGGVFWDIPGARRGLGGGLGRGPGSRGLATRQGWRLAPAWFGGDRAGTACRARTLPTLIFHTDCHAAKLGRKLRIFRLPDENPHYTVERELEIEIEPGRDNPLYVKVTQEDGHQAWSSPIWVIPVASEAARP